jgi:hypothetical protein
MNTSTNNFMIVHLSSSQRNIENLKFLTMAMTLKKILIYPILFLNLRMTILVIHKTMKFYFNHFRHLQHHIQRVQKRKPTIYCSCKKRTQIAMKIFVAKPFIVTKSSKNLMKLSIFPSKKVQRKFIHNALQNYPMTLWGITHVPFVTVIINHAIFLFVPLMQL